CDRYPGRSTGDYRRADHGRRSAAAGRDSRVHRSADARLLRAAGRRKAERLEARDLRYPAGAGCRRARAGGAACGGLTAVDAEPGVDDRAGVPRRAHRAGAGRVVPARVAPDEPVEPLRGVSLGAGAVVGRFGASVALAADAVTFLLSAL